MTLARFKHLLPLALLVAGLAALWSLGLQRDLSWDSLSRHQAELLAIVAARPIEAPIAYVVIYAFLVAFSVPEGALATIAGGLLFGVALGGALAVIGASIGAVILFLAVRYALADLAAAKAARLMARIRPGIERDGFLYLLALRLIPLFPFWLLNLAAAACGIRLVPFAAATLLGIIPGTLVYASVGAGLADVLAVGGAPNFAAVFSPRILLPLLGLAALTLVPVIWRAFKGPGGQALDVQGRNANGLQADGCDAIGGNTKGSDAMECKPEGHNAAGHNAKGRNAKGRDTNGPDA
jgi:uncharacterized membrane protein YdjX (TVP38/TMEM64 family)